MSGKISIIIPVYNTSLFLKKCLDSIINQTYKNLEIICINDGSTDDSLSILKEYQKKDDRIKIIDQKNKGQAAARNKGAESATGEYISFIDSDDWVDKNFFEKLHKTIHETNSDIAMCSIIRARKNSSKIRIKYTESKTYTALDEKIKTADIPRCCYVWNKLYRASLIKENKFTEGVFYEDVLWLPSIIKKAKSISITPDTNYYYFANSNSTVKKPQSKKKQIDSYNAKKRLIDFFEENNLVLTKKQKTITKSIKYLFNVPLLKVKEYESTEISYLFGFIPIFKKTVKKPIIKNNTFLVWEPCSISHSEVVPGYCKYLLDLGYHVSVLVTCDRYKEGLFSKFNHTNISYNKLSQKEIRKYFKNNSLENVEGVIVTTAGKICDCVHFEQAYEAFYPNADKKKILLVEHEASSAIDNNSWKEDLITLRKLNYKGASSIVVNPHYFGDVDTTPKNKDITNFITIGAIRPNKKNSQMIVDSVYEIYKRGYRNFKITVVGKGNIKHIPKEIRKYFDIKGRLPFKKMYDEIEKADFMLTSYNEYDPEHIRYNTTGTSGNFQLIYGFLKPCIITKGFAPINGLDEENSILYVDDKNYPDALETAINMKNEDYIKMQNNLKKYEQKLYQESLQNLKELING